MPWTIRPADGTESPAVVDLLNVVNPPEERITLEMFRHEDGMRRPQTAFLRLVAEDDGRLLAVGQTENSHLRPRHKFRIALAVHPRVRRQGVGTALEGRLREFAAARGGTELTAVIREDDRQSRAFLERHGYREAYQRFEMELDVTAFDWGRFPRWRERLGNLRLFALADVGVNDESLHRLFELAMVLTPDVPHPEGMPAFTPEDFRQFAAAPGFRADGCFLLSEGDRWVGISVVEIHEGRPAYTDFTGVERLYRGRGLATLLKLATIEFVQRQGVTAMRTNNDTVNFPMVAVNEKLGYRRLPARVGMKAELG
ncbi:MAG TPA: GNAT family N-acetyltransferase [bacterium]|nr:GNAT family N-acetyltransferase [bacterium]